MNGPRGAITSSVHPPRSLLAALAMAVAIALSAALSTLLPGLVAAASEDSPTASFVAVTSVPGGDGAYALGESIRVTLSFSEPVNVTGSPRLKIDMDPAAWGQKWAAYESGSGTSGLTFAHTVVEPNYSTQGIAVLADTLELDGGTITSTASQTNASLSHPGLDHDPDHRVNWQLPAPQPGRAPVVNTGTRNHERFVNEQNAPRGVLVSKSFAGLFSDPDGDRLTYSVAITGGRPQLAEDLVIGSWGRSDLLADKSSSPDDASMRVFLEADDDDDWDALQPPLEERPVITVTLTATDPSGLSASLQGKFLIVWEPEAKAAVTQLNLGHDPANIIGPQKSAPDQATGPTVTDVEVTSDPGSDDFYELGETINVSLTFSESVDVTGAPYLNIDMDPAYWGTKVVPYQSGSGTDTLTFAHVVVEPNYSMQGIAVLENSLALNGGTIKSSSTQADAALAHDGLNHQAAHRVNWLYPAQRPAAPAVTYLAISSDAGEDRSYAKGEAIRVTLRLSEAVNVTGAPRLKLDLQAGDGDERWASYASGSGSTKLVFAYAVAEGDDSQDGVAVLANSLQLNGGTIVSMSDGDNALLGHIGLASNPNHRVDCTPPALLRGEYSGGTLTLTFDEDLGAAESLSNAQFAVVRTPEGGTEESIGLTGAPVISGVSVTLTLASAIVDTDSDVKVSYTNPTTGQNNKLVDIAGNEVDSISDVLAMKDTTPPRLVSGQVDGDRLIFYFSEALDETSFGGWFRATISYPGGIRNSSTMSGGVEITGNKVIVGLGLGRVALAGATNNYAYYIKDERPSAKVLRDLAGNQVELRPGTDHTRFIALENITPE